MRKLKLPVNRFRVMKKFLVAFLSLTESIILPRAVNRPRYLLRRMCWSV